MIAFFIILTILFLFTLLVLIFLLSNIEIEIDNFCFDSNNKKYKKIEDYLIFIRLKFLDKITWLKIIIDNKKIVKIGKSKILRRKISKSINELEDIKEKILRDRKEILKINNIKKLNIRVKQLYLDMRVSALDNIITSFAVATISSIISIILARNIKKYEKDKYIYSIIPIYEDKPMLKIKLNCIIDIKIVHIMNVIYMLLKKRSGKYDERTSNRRAYVCSND